MSTFSYLNGLCARLVLPVIAMTGIASMTLAAPPEGEPTDPQIAGIISAELEADPAVSGQDVEVATQEGQVMLSGTVEHLLAKERAERIVRTVRGVRSVTNAIEVRPEVEQGDADLLADINEALLLNPATDAYAVEVDVEDGVVTLSGTVDSWQKRKLSEQVVGSVRGVRSVENNIDLDFAQERPDDEIKTEIEQALRYDSMVDHSLIDVAVENGVVALTGIVGSVAEQHQARETAFVAGVESVDIGGLQVDRWTRDEELRGDKYRVTPEDVLQAVATNLARDPRVSAADINVAFDDDTLTLTGTVDTMDARRAAANAARRTVGVEQVNNQISVRTGDAVDELSIINNVERAIQRDPYLEGNEIGVTVEDGTVTLTGMVDSDYERARADNVVSQVRSVQAVRNMLAVAEGSSPWVAGTYVDEDTDMTQYTWYEQSARQQGQQQTAPSESELRERIKDQLWWSPFVDETNVLVSVDEQGVATLTGEVGSLQERAAAEQQAYQGGAVEVVNELTVAGMPPQQPRPQGQQQQGQAPQGQQPPAQPQQGQTP